MGPEGRLELFVKAKQEINSIFSDSFKLLEEGSKLLCDINVENVRADLQLKDFRKEVSDLLERVSSITKVLARDQMKVAFFGSTSNGKSTTLNAMLQDQILPMGTGQTTNCLLSVHGSDQSCAYILEADSKIKWDVDVGAESSSKLADALRDGKLQQSSLVQVFWPKTRCKLLSEDVVLVDSPGIDVSPDLDQCIDKHCLDADVFVLVVNAESTLTMTEKNFFHKVNQRLSQPNIFILNNRWDVSELEPDTMEQVKIQHLQVEIGFLVNELKCVDKAQAEERVFFVSSKETLTTRMQKLKGMPREGGARHGEGFQARQMEFENFEMKLEECISKSAIKTKFGPHAMSGLKIAERMTDIMEQVEGLASQQRSLLEKNKKEQEDQFEDITRPLETCSAKVQSAIEEIQSTVKEQVADAMGETIGRLGSLVDKFNHPFHPYPSFVKTYIEDLLDYLETKLEGNVTACSLNSLTQLINNAQRHMAGCLENVLPQELPENVLQPDATSLDFQAIGKVDIRRLCDDFEFKADIDFHFGPEWLEKFLAPYLARLGNVLEANPQRSGRSFVSTAQYNTMSQSMEEVANSAQCVDAAPSIFTGLINLALHPGTWMAIAAAGLIFRPKYVLVILSFYGGKSIIQEWTTSAKAKALKRQFIEHVTERLRLAQSSISTNISNQVEQTLTSSLSKLKSLVQQETQSLEESVIEKQKKITTLETSESKATSLRNKASEVHSKLSQFKTVFGLA